jgi:sporulation protein YabP
MEEKNISTNSTKIIHNVILENRKTLNISGMTEVDCFDEGSIRLYTQMGELVITGKDLHIGYMSVETGNITIEGEVAGIMYGRGGKQSSGNFLGKIVNLWN